MESMIDVLRQQRKILSYEYNKIKKLPSPDEIDYEEVEILYNQFKKELGTAVVKSLNEVDAFKKKIHDFQRV